MLPFRLPPWSQWNLRALFVVALALFTTIFALSSGLDVVFRLAYVLWLILAVGWVWTRLSLQGVDLDFEGSKTYATVGERAWEQLTVYNQSWLPKYWLELRQETDLPSPGPSHVMRLTANGSRQWRLQFYCERRGRYTIGPTKVTSGDPFGLFRRQLTIGDTYNLTVYPATVDLTRFLLPPADLPGEGRYRRRTHFVTPNASTVRDYVYGDSYNRISWPTTARTGKLMVKEFELDPASETWIILDLDRRVQAGEGLQSTEEYAVTAAASVTRHYVEANRPIGLMSYGHHFDLHRPERGGHQLARVMESLALARAEGEVSLAELLAGEARRFGRFSTLLLITSSLDETWVNQLQHLMRRGARAAVVLIEPSTFGGSGGALLTVSTLMAGGVQCYLVKKAASVQQGLAALATPSDGSGAGTEATE